MTTSGTTALVKTALVKPALVKSALAVLLGIFLVATGPAPASAQTKPLTRITFSLDFIPLGRHAPWYAAVAKGYYQDLGLDVSIIPSHGTAQTIQAVEAGTAQIGFTDVVSLALARANGAHLKMVAVNYEKAPYAIFSLDPGGDVTEVKQLQGLTLGSGAGSFTPRIIRGFMAEHGLDPATLKVVNITPSARASALLSHEVPSIEFFVMSEPGLAAAAKARHAELKTFLLADHGLKLYSNGIVATDKYLAEHPDIVKNFVAASLRGWRFALSHPKQAVEDEIKFVPSLRPAESVAELEIVKGLAITPAVQEHGLGWFGPAGMEATLDFVIKYVGLKGTPPKATDLYATGFLPSPPIMP
ncbi:MAG: ABC transporter substrate-binding protein [Acetobacteraceae bacterium]